MSYFYGCSRKQNAKETFRKSTLLARTNKELEEFAQILKIKGRAIKSPLTYLPKDYLVL
ncbi:MAG: hypothetical protein LUH05_02485 [Candidatus Gastranaerophilales bacterium]|nr:hypothetical protein [Candidatus Gastranaerophilales bacterium]